MNRFATINGNLMIKKSNINNDYVQKCENSNLKRFSYCYYYMLFILLFWDVMWGYNKKDLAWEMGFENNNIEIIGLWNLFMYILQVVKDFDWSEPSLVWCMKLWVKVASVLNGGSSYIAL